MDHLASSLLGKAWISINCSVFTGGDHGLFMSFPCFFACFFHADLLGLGCSNSRD